MSAAAASASRRAASERSQESTLLRKGSKISASMRSSGRASSRSSSSRIRHHHQSSNSSEIIHASEYGGGGGGGGGGGRPRLTRDESYTQQSFRLLQETKYKRRFEATIMFKEYCLHNDKKRMKVDQLKPYVARVFNTRETSLEDEPVKLVLEEAIKKSEDEPEGILHIHGVVSAVINYGEYEEHCKKIQELFHASNWSKDGRLHRQGLRKFIQNYESKQIRSTEFIKNILLFVTEDDINFILKSADKNRDGDIDATEVVKAIGVWEELAAIKLNDFDNLNCQRCWNKGCAIS